MVVKDLKSLKYNELQKLAKNAGIKANQKIDKLIKALEAHYMESDDGAECKISNATSVSNVKKTPTVSTAVVGRKTPLAGGISKKTPTSGMATAKNTFTSLTTKKTPTSTGTCNKKAATSTADFSKKTPTISSANNTKKTLLTSTTVASYKKTPTSTTVVSKKTPTLTTVAASKKTPTSTTVAGKKPPALAGSSGKRPQKRRRTFELEEATLGTASTPTSDPADQQRSTRSGSRTNTPVDTGEPAGKRQRRNTFDKTEDTGVSPGTSAMIASMDLNLSSAERKSNLLLAIQKKVEKRVAASPSKSSQIPRFMASLTNMKKEAQSKPTTPGNKDWKKIHTKTFSKFDSLDVYLEKKQQRKDLLTNSASKRSNPGLTAKNNSKIAKPVVRPQVTSSKPFVPTVTSTKNLNFNFLKSPAAPKASAQSVSKTPKLITPSFGGATKFIGSTNRATPFKFTGGGNKNSSNLNTTSSATKKNVFDLKASLAKPLSWKPHTGKLQTLDINAPSVAVVPRPAAPAVVKRKLPASSRPSRQALASKSKGRPTNPKDVRRVQQYDRRSNQKYIDMMKRRGLM